MTAGPFDPPKPAEKLRSGGSGAEQVGVALSRELSALEVAVKRDLLDFERRLTGRIGGMLVVAVGIILAAFRYLPPR